MARAMQVGRTAGGWRGLGLLALVGGAALVLGGLLLGDDPRELAVGPGAQRTAHVSAHAQVAPGIRSALGGERAAGSAWGEVRCEVTALNVPVGSVREYALRYAAAVSTGQVELVRLEASGRVTVTCYEGSGDELLLGQRFVVSLGDGGEDPLATRALERELASEVLARVDRQGRVLALALPQAASPEARNLLRALVSAGQVELPRAPAARWEATGEDATGEYLARYTALQRDPQGVQVARRRAYTALHANGGLARAEVRGQAQATLRADGAPTALVSEELVTLSAAGAGVDAGEFQVETAASLLLTDERSLALEHVAARLAQAEQALGAGAWASGLAGEVASVVDAEVALRPIEDALAELAQALAAGELDAVGPRVFLELARSLAADPEAVERAERLLASDAFPLPVRATLLDALGEAGSEAAQLALVRAAAADLPPELLVSAYVAQGKLSAPVPAVLEGLEQAVLAEDPLRARWAAAAMGLIASGAEAPEVGEHLVGELEVALGADPLRDQALLEALGNAGRTRSYTAIASYLEAEDAGLRAGAVAALRKLPGEEVDALLGERAHGDASPLVRREAVRSLGERAPSARTQASVARVLSSERDPLVRLEAVLTLSSWLGQASGAEAVAVRSTLARLAAEDPLPEVRAAAQEYLAGGASNAPEPRLWSPSEAGS